MKKTFRILSMVLVILLLFTACATNTAPPAQTSTASAAASASSAAPSAAESPSASVKTDLPHYKIGILGFKYSGAWFERIASALKPLGEAYNCEFVNGEPTSTPDEVLAGIENLCASGVNGIIVFTTGGVTSRIVETCEKYKVSFVACDNDASYDSGYDTTKTNQYFVGSVAPNDYQTMYDITKEIISKGATKLATLGLPPGLSFTFDNRLNGAAAAVKDAGLTLVAEARSFNVTEAGQNLLTQNPDVQAILSGVDTMTYMEQPLLASGLAGKVQVTAFEDSADIAKCFKDGTITYDCDGNNVRGQICFALLYNAISGHKLTNDDGSAPVIQMDDVIMRSAEEFQAFVDKGAFSVDEMGKIIAVTTPDVKLDDVKATAANFTMEKIKAK